LISEDRTCKLPTPWTEEEEEEIYKVELLEYYFMLFIQGRQTSIVRDDNCLTELTPTENRASREAQRWQPHHSTTQPQTGTVLRNY
jgi:hypothetical protein